MFVIYYKLFTYLQRRLYMNKTIIQQRKHYMSKHLYHHKIIRALAKTITDKYAESVTPGKTAWKERQIWGKTFRIWIFRAEYIFFTFHIFKNIPNFIFVQCDVTGYFKELNYRLYISQFWLIIIIKLCMIHVKGQFIFSSLRLGSTRI